MLHVAFKLLSYLWKIFVYKMRFFPKTPPCFNNIPFKADFSLKYNSQAKITLILIQFTHDLM